MNPTNVSSDMWGIFFFASFAFMTCASASPITGMSDAWGIFFFTSFAAVARGGLVDRAQDFKDLQFPEVKGFIRIEANITRLENEAGVEHNGLPCDGPLGKCDPKVTAFIDTERPNHDFGGDSVPYRHYAVLLVADDVNSPTINKVVSRDICGGSVRKVNVRVRAEDVDTARNDDKIDNFSCFIYGLDTPATSEGVAKWSKELSCDGQDRKSTKIWFKYRWFSVNSTTCRPSSNDRGLLDGLLS